MNKNNIQNLAIALQKGGFEINNPDEFNGLMHKCLSEDAFLNESGAAAGSYVKDNSGALDLIMKDIKL